MRSHADEVLRYYGEEYSEYVEDVLSVFVYYNFTVNLNIHSVIFVVASHVGCLLIDMWQLQHYKQ
jgi:hypothetical protein